MESLSTFVQSPLFSRLSVILGGLILLGLFWWRAGSIHSVLDRLWRLIAGKADAHDPTVKSMLLESRDLEKFQFFYRLKVETLAEVRKLAAWMEAHGVGMSRLLKMRRWVNVTSPEVVLQPPRHYVWSHFAFGSLAMFAVAGISQFAASPDAYLQMRASKVWFKTDSTTVKAPLEGWSFDLANCATDQANVTHMTGFRETETEVICKALKDGGLKTLVKQTVEFQAWLEITGALIAIAIAFANILAAVAAQEALRLRKRHTLRARATPIPPQKRTNRSAVPAQPVEPGYLTLRSGGGRTSRQFNMSNARST